MQYCPSIRGNYSSPFNYVNPQTKALDSLWPLGPIGHIRHGQKGLQFKHDSARRVLIKVMTWSGSNSMTNLIRDIRSIEPGIRAAYSQHNFGNLCDQKLEQLVADTCFFLLVAFSILGTKLQFSERHDLFGEGCVKLNMEKWLRSIFFVGNQVPFILVDKLVNSLNYLKLTRDETKGGEPPSEWLQRALFEFIAYDSSHPGSASSAPPPVDVLHCLRSVILGPELQTLNIWVAGKNDAQGTASAFLEGGYVFKRLPRECGSRGIKCENQWQRVAVYLPYVEIVSETSLELAVVSADNYETAHSEFRPESKCYFSLLSHLTRSPEDVQVLHSHGIIGGRYLESLIRVLAGFYTLPRQIPSHIKKREIQSHKPRFYLFWKYKLYIIAILVMIRVFWGLISDSLQSGYTVAAYYKHRLS